MFDKLLVVYGVVRIPTVFFYITPNKEKILTRKTTFWYLVGDQYLKKKSPGGSFSQSDTQGQFSDCSLCFRIPLQSHPIIRIPTAFSEDVRINL